MDRALVVGINKYPGCPLHGCCNDAADMAVFLQEKCGFAASSVNFLADERATTQGIEDALRQLIEDVKPGDRIVFHYSGHGSQLVYPTAHNQLSDVICPVDFDFQPEHAISDQQFAALFAPVPVGVRLAWCSDSCHSGDLARNLVLGTPRAYPMPPEHIASIESARAKNHWPIGFARTIQHLHGVFLSGCRSDQTSADAVIDRRPCGAFTHFLLEELEEDMTEAMQEVRNGVIARLAGAGYEQEPQIHGWPVAIQRPWLG